MNSYIIEPKYIITADENNNIHKDKAVEIVDGRIHSIMDTSALNEISDREILKFPDYFLIPGFVQSHVHLCQSLFRGLAEDLELLDWLRKRIFPFEAAHDYDSLRASAKIGICELLLNGTTSILDMGTLNYQEAVFDELASSGIRAVSGKCMMDENDLYPRFKETTERSIRKSIELAETYHNSHGGRIKYGFAPRFVLSCTEELFIKAKELADEYEGSIFHTHSSENIDEIKAVRRLRGKENVEYFAGIGVLGSNTVLAHCIHLNESEIEQLKNSGTHVAHCPSANLKLGSGIAPVPRYLSEGISVSLGGDGAPCNNNLSQFVEMRLAGLIQKPVNGPGSISALELFRMGTINGAKALGLENEIGSIEIGKKADLVLLDLKVKESAIEFSTDSLYSEIVYASSSRNVKEVFVDGKRLVGDGIPELYHEEEISRRGDEELKKLLRRIN